MGTCFTKAVLPQDKKGDEVVFNKKEPSLTQSSDGMSWGGSGASLSAPRKIVNQTVNLTRRESEIIRTAKDNLRKRPKQSSLKGVSKRSEGNSGSLKSQDNETLSATNSGSELLAPSDVNSSGSHQEPDRDDRGKAPKSNRNGNQPAAEGEKPPIKRAVSFCQEVILIQYVDTN